MLNRIRHWLRKPGPEPGLGFREAVKDPRLWQQYQKSRAKGAQIAQHVADTATDEEVEEVLAFWVFGARHSRDFPWVLSALNQVDPQRLTPMIERMVRDERNEARLRALPPGGHDIPETPFNRVCDVLGSGAFPPVLIGMIESPNKWEKKDAVLVTCSTGCLEMLPVFESAVADEDEYVRSSALIGTNRAVQGNRLAPETVPHLFPSLLRMVAAAHNCGDAARLLLKLDRQRAESDLLALVNDGILDADSRYLFEVLRVFGPPGKLPAWERLEQLHKTFRGREMKFPNDYALGQVLRLIGGYRREVDEPLLRDAMSHENDDVASGAAAGLLALHGHHDAPRKAWDSDSKASPLPLRQYAAVQMLDNEVSNGGFSQYFFNSSGDAWPDALSGLEESGSTERLALFRAVLAAFPGGRPSTGRRRRGWQLAIVERKENSPLDLDQAWYDSGEHVEVLLTKLVLKHGQVFKKAPLPSGDNA